MQANALESMWIQDQVDPTGRVHVRDVQAVKPPGPVGDFTAKVQVLVPGEDVPREGLFTVELKTRSEPSTIRSFLEKVPSDPEPPLLLSAPNIGAKSGALLAERRISWLDTSGNYHLRLGDSVLERWGPARPGRSARSQRLAFAPKGSRIVRLLLALPERQWLTTEIAETAGIDPGHASRTLSLLREAGYVSREKAWRLTRPDALLEDWGSSYRFSRHDAQSFFSLTPRVEARMAEIVEAAALTDTVVAFTGSSAAVLWGALSAADDVVAYVGDPASRAAIVESIGMTPESRAANVTIVVPEDRGVFIPLEGRQDLPLVCRPQVYLDLLWSSRGQSLASSFLERMPWRD